MKKKFRIICCFTAVLGVLLLTGCKDSAAENLNTEGDTASGYESSQTVSSGEYTQNTSSINDNTVPDNSSDTGGAESNGQSDSSVITDTGTHTHSYSSKKMDATCTDEGYTLKTCGCGHIEKTDKVSALGHSFGSWITVKTATSSTTGLQRRECSRCGKTEDKVLEKLPQTASTLQAEILRLVNEERAKAGLNALQYYYGGQAAADVRAKEIDTAFSHTRPNGTSCFTALDEAGVNYRGAGENIAKGYTSAESVMNGWMNSSGHKANILNENFTHLIVGVNGSCWVQLFLTL